MSDRKSFSLEQVPPAEALEDLVASLFRGARYFVEAGIKKSDDDGVEVLELDAVATSYESGVPLRIVAEAKAGKNWGFPDAFKVLGWMQYLTPVIT